jgi:rhodanese-related sulfurtransferase
MEFIGFIQKNLLLFGIALVSGGMLVWPLLRRSTGGPWVSTLEATQLINREDAIVLDVRGPAEYAKGRLPGAKNIAAADMERRIGEVAKNKSRPVVVYCGGDGRSGRALDAIRKLGFERAYNLTGGYGGWKQAGLPTEK